MIQIPISFYYGIIQGKKKKKKKRKKIEVRREGREGIGEQDICNH